MFYNGFMSTSSSLYIYELLLRARIYECFLFRYFVFQHCLAYSLRKLTRWIKKKKNRRKISMGKCKSLLNFTSQITFSLPWLINIWITLRFWSIEMGNWMERKKKKNETNASWICEYFNNWIIYCQCLLMLFKCLILDYKT